jgi:hypothetical protein
MKIIIFLKLIICKYEEMKRKEHSGHLFRLLLAIILALMLAAAAIIKIVYPSPLLDDFFFAVSIFEIALAIALAIFWNQWQIWSFMVLVFTTFGGYSLYAAIFGLPCRCLGVAVTLPRATSLIVNILIVYLCWIVLNDFKLKSLNVRRLAILSGFLFVIGFVLANYIYHVKF